MLRRPAPRSRRPAPVQAPRVVSTAREAVRAIRLQVRTAHVLGMTPREVERAVEWAESGWRVALALLGAGEPCGFTVVLGSGAVLEWTVRPVNRLELRVPAVHHRSEADA
ncbi:hypothetical protein [Streptomyces sp. NPDC088757]|uniref:hypothetical protein n=1 Tax=Streptomyces sp. NPDC088757 TaxID=3365889 RepID=UPI00382B178F